jgi:DNA-binding transcriptional LysR family regulator
MNLHHLELFHYVARHGGIMEAVRNIPYGIQQPAVSGQMAQLEQDLGQRLFIRRPFSLTPAGRRLFEFIHPFFSQLPSVGGELRGEGRQRLRFAGPTLVLREHLPALFGALRRRYPRLSLELREATQSQVESLLLQQEIDAGIAVLEEKVTHGIDHALLVQLPLTLLVQESRPERNLAAMLKRNLLNEPLIAFPPTELLHRRLRDHLTTLQVDWPTSIEVNSLDLIARYVLEGFGVGLSVQVPGAPRTPGLREIPLKEIPALRVGVLWRKPLTEVAEAFIETVKQRARSLGGQA